MRLNSCENYLNRFLIMVVSKKISRLFFVIRLTSNIVQKFVKTFLETLNEQYSPDNSFVSMYLFTYMYIVICLKVCNVRMRIYMYL